VFISVLAMLAITIMANYLASRHYRRFYWSDEARAQLTPYTRMMLAAMTNQVQVIVLFDPEESSVYYDVKDLLTEYQLNSPHLEVEYVNYGRNPGRADLIKAQYQLSSGPDSLVAIFDCSGRPPRVVRERELSDFDVSGALQGEPVRRTTFKGEQLFSSAILSVLDTKPLKACYLVGHGELDITAEGTTDGYFRFAQLLSEKNISLEPLDLRANDVPDDAQLLVIGGPRTPIPPEEIQKIDQYLKHGGRAIMLLFSPSRANVRPSGLDRMLLNWGVELGNNLVLDRGQSQSSDSVVILTDQLGSHPIVNPLRGLRLAMVMPCSVRPRSGNGRGPETANVTELIMTTEEGQAVVPMRRGGRTEPVSAMVETNGVIPIAVAVERGTISGVSPDRGTTRLVVVGEAQFLANGVIGSEAANRDFAALAVNWLLDRSHLLDIQPQPVQEYRILLTRAQMNAAAWILLGALPGGVLLCGVLVWLNRRH
jgi:hypothetical protein